jgi:hypothetical protein
LTELAEAAVRHAAEVVASVLIVVDLQPAIGCEDELIWRNAGDLLSEGDYPQPEIVCCVVA